MVPHHVEIQITFVGGEKQTDLQAVSAFVNTSPQITDPCSLMKMGKTKSMTNLLDQLANLGSIFFRQSPQPREKIRINFNP